jgi:hypothetical protein
VHYSEKGTIELSQLIFMDVASQTKYMEDLELRKVMCTCNFSFLRDGSRRTISSRSAQAKVARPCLKNIIKAEKG